MNDEHDELNSRLAQFKSRILIEIIQAYEINRPS